MPRRPARPVSCVYSPGVRSTCASPFHLSSFSITTVRAGMLMPSASVSVANTALIIPRVNSSSTISLNVGSIPAWWAATPRCRASGSRRSRGSAGPRARCRRCAARRARGSPPPPPWRSAGSRRAGTAGRPRRSRARLKMNVIAGSSPARSSRSITSGRAGGRNRCGRGARRRPVRRPWLTLARRTSSTAIRVSCGFRRACRSLPLPVSTNRSYRRVPTIMCWNSGTGRCSSTITAVSPRTSCSHSPNSSALLTVADSATIRTESGTWMITSSQTAPRNRSAR